MLILSVLRFVMVVSRICRFRGRLRVSGNIVRRRSYDWLGRR